MGSGNMEAVARSQNVSGLKSHCHARCHASIRSTGHGGLHNWNNPASTWQMNASERKRPEKIFARVPVEEHVRRACLCGASGEDSPDPGP